MQYNFWHKRLAVVLGDGVKVYRTRFTRWRAAGCKIKRRKSLQKPPWEGTEGWRQTNLPAKKGPGLGTSDGASRKPSTQAKKRFFGAFGVKTCAFWEKIWTQRHKVWKHGVPHGKKTWRATWYENMACHMVWKQGRIRVHNWVVPLIVLLEAY